MRRKSAIIKRLPVRQGYSEEQALKSHCDYHILNPPNWRCEQCERYFCDACVPAGHDIRLRSGGPKCAICFHALDYLGSAVDAKSPTEIIFQCLHYPFGGNALIVLLPLAVCISLFSIGTTTPFVGFTVVPLLALLCIALEYGGNILNSTSRGDLSPPTLAIAGKGIDGLFLLRHVALVGLGITVTRAAGQWHPLFGYLIGSLCLALLPAAMMTLTRDRSLSSALNPLLLLSIIKVTGKHYWIGCAYCVMLAAVIVTLLKYAPFLWAFAFLYGLYSAYALFGYLLFYYQYDLGSRITRHDPLSMTRVEFDKRRALSDSYVLFKENHIDRARDVIRDAFKRHENDLDLHWQYHTFLLAADDSEALMNHTNALLNLLVNGKNFDKAQKIFLESQRQLSGPAPNFLPASAGTCFQMAEYAKHNGKPDLAIQLLKNFHERFPNANLIPQAYLLAATIFKDELRQPDKARFLIDYLIQHFPHNPLTPRILALRAAL